MLPKGLRKRMADKVLRDKYGPCFKHMDVRCGVRKETRGGHVRSACCHSSIGLILIGLNIA